MQSDSTLGEFIRAVRARLKPEQFNLPRGRRRTPGLRREEVAMICDISTTWYTWLEQGRTTAVSSQVLARIARNLQLSEAERRYLFKLAHQLDNEKVLHWTSLQLTEWQNMLQTIQAPAYLMDRHWDVIASNQACKDLFQGWLDQGHEHNLLRFIFFNPLAKTLIVDWTKRAARIVAEYRADSVNWKDDPVHHSLIDELSAGNALFEQFWQQQNVESREGGLRAFDLEDHTETYQQMTFRLAEHADIKMVLLSPK